MAAILITYTNPAPLDPTIVVGSRIRTTTVSHDGEVLIHHVEYLNAEGDVVDTEQQRFTGQAVQDWIASQKTVVGNQHLNRRNTTGTIA